MQGLNPSPIWASLAPVNCRAMEFLPRCVLAQAPNNRDLLAIADLVEPLLQLFPSPLFSQRLNVRVPISELVEHELLPYTNYQGWAGVDFIPR